MKPESSRYIFLLGLILLVLVIGAYFFTWIFDRSSPLTRQLTDAGKSMSVKDPQSFTTFETGEDFETLKKKNKKQLENYGWVDQNNNVAHIPIERAMQLIVKRYANE